MNGPERIKDTVRNVKSTKGFVVSIISDPWVVQANMSSIDAPENISEWPLSGLTKEGSIHVKAPRVKESAFSMECELLQAIDIINPATQITTTTMILGSVKYIHVRKDVLTDKGIVDPGKLKAVGRMGDNSYSRATEGFRLLRPSWQVIGEDITKAVNSA